jgi:hypothetical protein
MHLNQCYSCPRSAQVKTCTQSLHSEWRLRHAHQDWGRRTRRDLHAALLSGHGSHHRGASSHGRSTVKTKGLFFLLATGAVATVPATGGHCTTQTDRPPAQLECTVSSSAGNPAAQRSAAKYPRCVGCNPRLPSSSFNPVRVPSAAHAGAWGNYTVATVLHVQWPLL